MLSLAALVDERRGAHAAFSDLPQPATVAAAAADALGGYRHTVVLSELSRTHADTT